MRNRMHTLSIILSGMLLGNAVVLYAAEEAPAETPAADTSEDQTAEEMLAAEAALEAQEAAAGENDAAEPATAGTAETDEPDPSIADEDFVPTIQISEDLSVSFPVDI